MEAAPLWRRGTTIPYGLELPGRTVQASPPTKEGFTGHEKDGATGLVYAGARYYMPAVPRWTAVDPWASRYPALGPYTYVNANPLTYVDPNGKGILPKIIKVAVKVSRKGFNKASVVEAFAGNIQDAQTVLDSDASLLDRGIAAGSLASELLPVSVDDVKTGLSVGASVLGLAKSADKAGDASKVNMAAKLKETVGTTDGPRTGKSFTPAGKRKVIERNARENNGVVQCEYCGVETVPAQKSKKGVTPPGNEAQVDHKIPKSKGGDGDPSNGQVLCRDCNRAKSDKDPRDYQD